MKLKIYLKYFFLLLVATSLFTVDGFAQARKVSGKVVGSDDNSGIPGASVTIKGTTRGGSTDAEGNYSIDVRGPNDVLVFSFLGYTTQQITVGNQTTINVTLASDVSSLEEVVVTGYSVDKRKESTGAVSIVKSKDLTTVPSSSVEQQLQGRVAGLTVVTTSQPGSGSQIRVRGFGAFGGNQPLVIVDGYPVGNADYLNPEDIETTTVLKDASAASIYGARAANGVIVYTTKKGKKGAKKLSITYDGIFGFTDPGKGQKMMNPQDQATWTWNALRNSGSPLTHPQYGSGATPVIPDYLKVGNQSGVIGTVDLAAEAKKYNITGPTIGDFYQVIKANKAGTDWYDALTQTGTIQRHTLGFSGGGEGSRFYIGFSAQDQHGILASQKAKRYAARINTEFDVFKNVRIGENLQLTYFQILGRDGDNGGLSSSQNENDILAAFRSPTILPVYDEFGGYAGTTALGFGQGSNPVANQQRGKLNRNFNGLATGNIYIEIDPIKDLTIKSSVGMNYINSYGWGYGQPIYETLENKGVNWSYNESSSFALGYTITNTATYKKKFGIHGIELLAGHEALNTGFGKNLSASGRNPFAGDIDYITISKLDIINPAQSGKNNGITFLSYFGRAIYNLNEKYIITGVLRRDGSSRFGSESRYGVFPAVSAAWRLSDESFMKEIPWITDLKVRGGYGTMGNSNNVDPGNQFSLYAQDLANSVYDIAGSNAGVTSGFKQSRIGNPAAKWETSITKNIGFDGTFFKSRLEVVLDLWQKDTKDLLYRLPITQTVGGATPPSVNVGTMVNKGIDVQVINRGKIAKEVAYEVNVTGSFLHNEITKIGGNLTYLLDVNPGFRGVNPIRNQLGYSLSAFYGYKVAGLFQSQEEVTSSPAQDGAAPGRFRYQDVNNDGKINSDDRTYLGSPVPTFTGGLNFTLKYKNFELLSYFYTSIGNKIFNLSKRFTDFYPLFAGSAISERVKDSWTPQNRDTKIPIFEANDGFSTGSQASDFYVEDGSYLRFQNLSLAYNVPSTFVDKLKLGSLRLNASVNNLFTITKYGGLDPQVAGAADTNFGIDLGNFPMTRQVNFGINVGF
ncbi:SusC/RagA family TonB-linked outer membrane protein [Emticicia sp. CRIBPO]|uniref:SusC/RagA family TonB-linked outer membrane protein n=1 Tax=Emticicia sp. CRIBPO TaxID=2683258 RepID=UPI001411D2E1|nr:TonB-dependent receptor [Emticicia sp. CRIBPO]NBA88675.1 SusC/RagA family TonB-linked outer membrane protein [Emticicia sp. CRIBPO]